ncbi:MAG: hypothetical protein WCQ99_16010, partial [Pseudomonadota bacterium]
MLADLYDKLLCRPQHLCRDFILHGKTYAEVHGLAAGIRCLKTHAGHEIICLCTQDKALIAAALIASMSGGPRFVLP